MLKWKPTLSRAKYSENTAKLLAEDDPNNYNEYMRLHETRT